MKITELNPYFDNNDIDYVLKHFRSILQGNQYLTMGEFGESFERCFSKFTKSKYAAVWASV